MQWQLYMLTKSIVDVSGFNDWRVVDHVLSCSFFMLRDDEEYKRAQEAWVSNCTGGSITEILVVVSSLVVCLVHLSHGTQCSSRFLLLLGFSFTLVHLATPFEHSKPKPFCTNSHLCYTSVAQSNSRCWSCYLGYTCFDIRFISILSCHPITATSTRIKSILQVLSYSIPSRHHVGHMHGYFSCGFPYLSTSICKGGNIWHILGKYVHVLIEWMYKLMFIGRWMLV